MATPQEVAQLFTGMVSRISPDKAAGIDAIIQFDLSGDNGGLYWLKIANGQAETGQGQAENPKVTLKAAADDWYAVATGQMNAMQAAITGKLKVSGDMGLAMKLQSIM